MNKFFIRIVTVFTVIVLMVGLSGCSKEGPAEKAGKRIDKTMEKAGEQAEKASDSVRDTINDVKE